MPECKTVEHLHKQIKELEVPRNLGSVTSKQRPFALMYTMYAFAEMAATKNVSPTFFSGVSNYSFNSRKVIHHFHVTREIHGYVHNFATNG